MNVLEVMSGSRPIPARFASRPVVILLTSVWWLVLLAMAFAFMGRNVKFIYIDF